MNPGNAKNFAYRKENNILLERYKAIYFPVPKVASSSLKVVFSDALGLTPPDPQNPTSQPHKRDFPFAERDRVAADYADYFKFAVVRNPFSRILSCYRNKVANHRVNNPSFVNGIHKGFQRYGDTFKHDMPFDDFLRAIASIPDKEADNHFKSQFTFVSDSQGRLLIDYAAKFERLADEVAYIFDKIGLVGVTLPHLLNSGKSPEYRESYSEEGRKLMYKRYAKDFELFNYAF
ncbi:MAG: sulfotransferase family 2 domain-containing protein [Thiobacillus sp.]|nr:sulfotransferase family 2 domain-containing protein [Thiobacillus sp.]